MVAAVKYYKTNERPESMKPIHRLCLVLILGCCLAWPLVSHAEEQPRALQLSLFGPIQWHSEDDSIKGLRLNMIYGANVDVQWIDLGLFNLVKRDFKGLQVGLVANVTRRTCEGIQAAIFYNDAGEDLHGLQIGIVNHTGSLNGIQIGVINFNDDTRYLGFFPFINAAF